MRHAKRLSAFLTTELSRDELVRYSRPPPLGPDVEFDGQRRIKASGWIRPIIRVVAIPPK